MDAVLAASHHQFLRRRLAAPAADSPAHTQSMSHCGGSGRPDRQDRCPVAMVLLVCMGEGLHRVLWARTQRAEVNCDGSETHRAGGIPSSIRLDSTRTQRADDADDEAEPIIGLNTLAAPSSANCISALSRCLQFIGRRRGKVCSSSAQKDGMPVKRSASPRSARRRCALAGFGDADRMSPAQAPRPVPRSEGRGTSPGLLNSPSFLSSGHASASVPRRKWPEGGRTKATSVRGAWGPCCLHLKTEACDHMILPRAT